MSDLNEQIIEVSSLIDEYNERRIENETKKPIRRKTPRPYAFCISTYIQTVHVDEFLRSSNWVQHWAYCFHDKDTWTQKDNENNSKHIQGEPKEPHTHIILYTYNGKSSSSVKKLFDRFSIEKYGIDNKQNTFVEVCNDMTSQYRYLLHFDDPDRYPYFLTPEIRICDSKEYWSKHEKTDGLNNADNKGLAMVNDVILGVPYRTMCERYGKEYIYHYNHVTNMANRIYRQENGISEFNEEHIRSLMRVAPYTSDECNLFWQILHYLKSVTAFDYKVGNELEFNLKEVLK